MFFERYLYRSFLFLFFVCGEKVFEMQEIKKFIRFAIDDAVSSSRTILDLVTRLLDSGVVLSPATLNSETKEFNTCKFYFGDLSFTGTQIGSTYTAKEILKRGVSYNKHLDYSILERMFVLKTSIRQKEIIERIVMTDECKRVCVQHLSLHEPIRISHSVLIQASIGGQACSFSFETIKSNNLWTGLDLESPSPLLLCSLSREGFKEAWLDYDSQYELCPCRLKSDGLIIELDRNNPWEKITEIIGIDMNRYKLSDFDFEMPIVEKKYHNAKTGDIIYSENMYDAEYSIECGRLTLKKKGP